MRSSFFEMISAPDVSLAWAPEWQLSEMKMTLHPLLAKREKCQASVSSSSRFSQACRCC